MATSLVNSKLLVVLLANMPVGNSAIILTGLSYQIHTYSTLLAHSTYPAVDEQVTINVEHL